MKRSPRWRALGVAALTLGLLMVRPAAAEPAFVGLKVQGVEVTIARALGMDVPRGVLVRDIALGSPGDLAGFRRGDLIVEFDGTAIDRFEKLINLVRGLDAGAKVEVKVQRAGGPASLDLNTVAWPDPWLIPKDSVVRIGHAGLSLAALTPKVREEHGIRWGSTGVLVSGIDAAKSVPGGLVAGDLIAQVDQRDVWTPQQLDDALEPGAEDGPGERLLLVEGRQGFRFVLIPTSGEPAHAAGGKVADLVAVGLQIETLTGAAAAALGLGGGAGVLVRDAVPGSAAAAAGLRRGDLILDVDGRAATDADGFARQVRQAGAGSSLTFAVSRPDGRTTRTMTVPMAPHAAADADGFANLPAAGITIATVTPETRKSFGLRWASGGVVVTLVDGASAPETDLKRGDLIFQVGQSPVRSPDDLVAAYRKARGEGLKNLLLTVEDASGSRFSLLPVR